MFSACQLLDLFLSWAAPSLSLSLSSTLASPHMPQLLSTVLSTFKHLCQPHWLPKLPNHHLCCLSYLWLFFCPHLGNSGMSLNTGTLQIPITVLQEKHVWCHSLGLGHGLAQDLLPVLSCWLVTTWQSFSVCNSQGTTSHDPNYSIFLHLGCRDSGRERGFSFFSGFQ